MEKIVKIIHSSKMITKEEMMDEVNRFLKIEEGEDYSSSLYFSLVLHQGYFGTNTSFDCNSVTVKRTTSMVLVKGTRYGRRGDEGFTKFGEFEITYSRDEFSGEFIRESAFPCLVSE